MLSPQRSMALLLGGQPHNITLNLTRDARLPLTLQNQCTAGIRHSRYQTRLFDMHEHVQDMNVSSLLGSSEQSSPGTHST